MVLRTNGLKNRGGLRKRRKKAPPIMCECGVKSNYGLVPSELEIGHYCGHMVEYFVSFAKTYMI